jgi:Family of unknown function (DUF6226)
MGDQDAPHSHITERPYGRVTNAGRFATLHSVALQVIDQLQSAFDVERVEPYENDDDLDRFARVPLVRPTVGLVPQDAGCAPIVIAFSAFPGLLVRCRRILPAGVPKLWMRRLR